jgi:hypothetical protein
MSGLIHHDRSGMRQPTYRTSNTTNREPKLATKYQVFISSTYEDLKQEREIVIKAVLEMGHIPIGMEMFSAADEEQWRIIARHIDESDYYCVLVAHRYGSVTEGISYTRKEYQYAIDQGIPALGFLVDDTVSWPPEMIDKNASDVEALTDFKNLVKTKPISRWKGADDLYGKVSIALMKEMTANPRDGWVRASTAMGPQVTVELTRLSAENASLRSQIDQLSRRLEGADEAEVRASFDDLRSRKLKLNYKYVKGEKEWSVADKLTLASCLFNLAPSLTTEIEVTEAAAQLAMYIRKDKDRPWWTVATNQMRDVFSDLMALGLVTPSKRKHGVTDKGQYWTLTDLGHAVHLYGRRKMMELREGPAKPQTDESAPAKKAPAKATPTRKAPAKATE